MMEQPPKIHFSLLPFSPELHYLQLKEINNTQNSFDSNESIEDDSDSNFNEIIQCTNVNGLKQENSSFNINLKNCCRKKKTFVNLNEKELNFQFSFYQIFTTRKKFPKKYVVLIHNEICSNLKLRRINRDETRSISFYFHNFAKHAEKILLFIKNNKSEIIRRLPELQKVMRQCK